LYRIFLFRYKYSKNLFTCSHKVVKYSFIVLLFYCFISQIPEVEKQQQKQGVNIPNTQQAANNSGGGLNG